MTSDDVKQAIELGRELVRHIYASLRLGGAPLITTGDAESIGNLTDLLEQAQARIAELEKQA